VLIGFVGVVIALRPTPQLFAWSSPLALFGAATIPFAWTRPSPFDLGLMALVGVVSMLCFILITRALALARAAVLAPLQYSAIVWAALMGWIVWRDAPTLPIIVGNAVIIAGGLYLAASGFTAARAAPPD
jgi:S-adenosylmethionine uptake transporter